MHLEKLVETYRPSTPGFVVAHVIPFLFPKIGPFLKIWYHAKELYNNKKPTDSHVQIVDLYLPHKKEITTVELTVQQNFTAFISNFCGFLSGVADLLFLSLVWTAYNPTEEIDDYIKCYRSELEGNTPKSLTIFVLSFVLSCASALAGIASFFSNHKMYINHNTGE